MRSFRLFLAIFACSLGLSAGATAQSEAPEDARAYAVGFESGSFILERLQADGVELDVNALLAGLEDALRGAPSRLNETRTRMLLQRLEEEVRGREAERLMQEDPVFRALAEDNLRRSNEFLERFAGQEGVTVLDNGIAYLSLAEGQGESPVEDSTVSVTFDADLIDGTRFADGNRVSFVVGDLHDGARIAVQRMKPGSHWIVAIPPDLAFGLAGRAPDVGPNEAIVVEIELHCVEAGE